MVKNKRNMLLEKKSFLFLVTRDDVSQTLVSHRGKERTLLWIVENDSTGIKYVATDPDSSEEHHKAPIHLW